LSVCFELSKRKINNSVTLLTKRLHNNIESKNHLTSYSLMESHEFSLFPSLSLLSI